MECYVYLIRCGETSFYKIGISQNPLERLANLQTANPHQLSIITTCRMTSKIAATSAEMSTHQKLAPYNIHNEWFDLTDKQIQQLICDMAYSTEIAGIS